MFLGLFKKNKFDFDRKVDILGLWGKVATDARDSDIEQIHSLSFITNECPSRSVLELESHLLNVAERLGDR